MSCSNLDFLRLQKLPALARGNTNSFQVHQKGIKAGSPRAVNSAHPEHRLGGGRNILLHEMMDTRSSEMFHEKVDTGLSTPFPEGTFIIVGAGRFGKIAALRLGSKRHSSLCIVDKKKERLGEVEIPHARKICCDGPEFLSTYFHLFHSSNIIVPAVPVHLAYEWLMRSPPQNLKATQRKVPLSLIPLLPHTWETDDGSLLISHADSLCPDDCPEPDDYCTLTGKKRGTPLHELLSHMDCPGYGIHIVESRQLEPGVGGYRAGDLDVLLRRVLAERKGKWLVGTACKCHGIVSALEFTL